MLRKGTGTKLHVLPCYWVVSCKEWGYLDIVVAVQRESVVDTLRQHDHIPLPTVYPDPSLVKVAHIKVPCSMFDRLTLVNRVAVPNKWVHGWMDHCQFGICWYSTGDMHRTVYQPGLAYRCLPGQI